MLRKQYNQRGKLLKEEKEATAKARRETDRLRELLLFNDGDEEEGKDPLDMLDEPEERENVEPGTDHRMEEGKAETGTDQQQTEGKGDRKTAQSAQIDPFSEVKLTLFRSGNAFFSCATGKEWRRLSWKTPNCGVLWKMSRRTEGTKGSDEWRKGRGDWFFWRLRRPNWNGDCKSANGCEWQ